MQDGFRWDERKLLRLNEMGEDKTKGNAKDSGDAIYQEVKNYK